MENSNYKVLVKARKFRPSIFKVDSFSFQFSSDKSGYNCNKSSAAIVKVDIRIFSRFHILLFELPNEGFEILLHQCLRLKFRMPTVILYAPAYSTVFLPLLISKACCLFLAKFLEKLRYLLERNMNKGEFSD